IDDFRIMRIRRNVTALAAAHRMPVGTVNSTSIAGAGNAYGAVVLLRSIDVIGKAVVSHHMIELRGGLVALGGPACAAIGAHIGPAIVGFNHAVRVDGVNPQAMIVAMGNANGPEGAPAIQGAVHGGVQHIHCFRQAMTGESLPGTAAITGAVQAASGAATVHAPG